MSRNIKSIEFADLQAIQEEAAEVLAPIAKKYGVRFSFGNNLQNNGENATIPFLIKVAYGPDDNIRRNRFGLYCEIKEFDRKYGLTVKSYGKTYTFDGRDFKVLDFLYNGELSTCVTVACEGEVYQMPPAFVGGLESGKLNEEKWKLQVAAILTTENMGRYKWSNNPGIFPSAKEIWVDNCSKKDMGLKSDDFGKAVRLHGKKYRLYAVDGFWDWNVSGNFKNGCNVALVRVNDDVCQYAVPIAKVLYALGRL